jgi:hypothetical protein
MNNIYVFLRSQYKHCAPVIKINRLMLFVMQVCRIVKSAVKFCDFMTGVGDRLINDYGAIGGIILNGETEVPCLEIKTEIL